MPITIVDNNGSIKITNGTQVRNVMKSQIIEVSVIKTNIIKIDIGQGALHNIFIPHGDVTAPVTANPAALRDAISSMLDPEEAGSMAGYATEAKQDNEITQLAAINTAIAALQALMDTLNEKWFYPVQREDDGGAGTVYKGYCLDTGSLDNEPVWAIERIRLEGEVHVHTWANGNRNFTNVWSERETLAYS